MSLRILWSGGFLAGDDFHQLNAKSVETCKVLDGLLRSIRRER